MEFELLWGNPFKKRRPDFKSDIDFLSTVPIFDTLSRRQKLKLFPLIHIRTYKEGEIVFRQDDPGVGLYIIRDGQVDVYHEKVNMIRRKIITLNKGDFFGDISLLNESPRSATVVANQNSILFGFFKPDLLVLMDSDPKLGSRLVYRLAQIIAERLRLYESNIPG